MGGGLDHPGQNGATALAFTAEGKRLAAGTGLVRATFHVWDFATGKELAGFSTGQPSIHSLAFSTDGKALVSGTYDKQVRLWDPVKGKELRRLDGPSGQHKAVAFSPDGKR